MGNTRQAVCIMIFSEKTKIIMEKMVLLEKLDDILLSKPNLIFDLWVPNLHQKVKRLSCFTELAGNR